MRNRLVRKRTPITGLPERLLEQRNLIRTVLGQQWWQATVLSAGRLLFDYLCLLFSVRAVGAHPRPSLILLAYAVAGIIGLVPITPGGLGIVEASLSGVLVLAGLTGVQAVLATLAYRLASYWLPLIVGALRLRRFQVPLPPPERPATRGRGDIPDLRGAAPVPDLRGAAAIPDLRGAAPAADLRGAAPADDLRGAAAIPDLKGAAAASGGGRPRNPGGPPLAP